MKKNMGGIDKIIRVILALVAGLLVYFEIVDGVWAYVFIIRRICTFLTFIIFSNFKEPYFYFSIKTLYNGIHITIGELEQRNYHDRGFRSRVCSIGCCLTNIYE